MKLKTFFLLFCLYCFANLQAQNNYNGQTIFNCDANLLNAQFADSTIQIIRNVSYAKPFATNIAPDVYYGDQSCIQSSPCSTTGEQLNFDIYYPGGFNYDSMALPVIFIFHGGGFDECSSKSESNSQNYCFEFAKRGFVAINVEYRRGASLVPGSLLRSASYCCAMYRGCQDLRGAIRSAIKMQRDSIFTGFRFDSTNIFIGGAGTVPLNVAYYDQQMVDTLFPGIKNALGNLNADFYYADSTVSYKIKGVQNISGAAVAPINVSADKFVSKGIVPAALISFTGLKDPVAPYKQGYVYYGDSTYTVEINCLIDTTVTFHLNNLNGPAPDQIACGGEYLYNYLKSKRIPAELYLDCKMGHDFNLQTAFGLGPTTSSNLISYVTGRTATFFQAVVNKIASKLNDTRFVNCVNYRSGCSIADSNNECNNTMSCNVSSLASDVSNVTTVKKRDELFSYTQINQRLLMQLYTNNKSLIYLYDVNGNLRKLVSTLSRQADVYTGDLNSGIYFLKVVSGNKMQTIKVPVNMMR